MNNPEGTEAKSRGGKASLFWVAGPILVVVVTAALFRWPLSKDPNHRGDALLFQEQATAPNASPIETAPTGPTENQPQGSAVPGAPRPEFLAWFTAEAKGVSDLKVDEVQREQRIQQQVRTLTSNDWSEVARRLMDQGLPMNDRLLSGFLLGRGAFDHLDLVDEVLEKPLPSGNPPPHSIEESEMMREKSLRLMIIEEMIQAAKKDRSKLASLEQAIRKIEDAHLRSLAERRMKEEGL